MRRRTSSSKVKANELFVPLIVVVSGLFALGAGFFFKAQIGYFMPDFAAKIPRLQPAPAPSAPAPAPDGEATPNAPGEAAPRVSTPAPTPSAPASPSPSPSPGSSPGAAPKIEASPSPTLPKMLRPEDLVPATNRPVNTTKDTPPNMGNEPGKILIYPEQVNP